MAKHGGRQAACPADRIALTFTGTSSNLTKQEERRIFQFLLQRLGRFIDLDFPVDQYVIVVGGCVGVDTYIAHLFHDQGFWVHLVLPDRRSHVDPAWKYFCTTYEVMPAGTSYLQRDDRLVALGTRQLAIARTLEILRSGTWATVRRGRKKGITDEKDILILAAA